MNKLHIYIFKYLDRYTGRQRVAIIKGSSISKIHDYWRDKELGFTLEIANDETIEINEFKVG